MGVLTCCVCGDPHHALQCPLARTTILAAGIEPGAPPEPGYRPACRDEITETFHEADWTDIGDALIAVHDALVAEGRRLWYERRGLPARTRTTREHRGVA